MVGGIRKAKWLQEPSDRRIDPSCDHSRREIRFDILDRQLILTKIAGETAGPDAFIPDHADLVAPNDIVLEIAIC